jgi:Cft2 family RNA processing exonuclease
VCLCVSVRFKRNLIKIITLAKHLINESPSEITKMAGQKVKVNCSVEYISFSAHTDFKQSSDVSFKLI